MLVSMMEPLLHTLEGGQGQVRRDETLRASVDNPT
jgi:hypothetical protein